MRQKIVKIIVCVIAIMTLFSNSLIAFAENDDLDFDFNIQPIEPTSQEEIIETEKETEKETERETKEETKEETTQKPKPKPTKPQETKAPETHRNDSDNGGNDVNVNTPVEEVEQQTTEPENTEEALPEGSFYVFLERNNGQRRLKTVMTGVGYLPEPTEPVRKGYIFVGWYSDPNFEKPWNFFTDKAKKEMTIYAKWETDSKTVAYDITIKNCVGGTIEVNPRKASLGEPVVLTIVPDEGKRLVQGSIKINGEATDFLSFIMPKGNVTISAEFEDIPDEELSDEKSKLPLFIALGVVAVVILAIAIVIAKRRSDFNADLDPDEDIIEEFEDEDWIDESIVVEAGFKEGKKVVESVEPDYGTPEEDIEDFE